jgi:molecular chaperone GrpE
LLAVGFVVVSLAARGGGRMNKREQPLEEGDEANVDSAVESGEVTGADDGDVPPLEDDKLDALEGEDPQIASLSDQLRTTEGRLREVSKRFRELQDEMQAFRERAQNQAELKAGRQAFEAVKVLLEPVQNLGRSLETPGEDAAALIEGLKLVYRQFRDALDSLGLEPVPGKGAPFDPNVHEAIAVSPVDEDVLDNKVLEVLQPGFMVKGKVLHPAQVVIGQYSRADDVEG